MCCYVSISNVSALDKNLVCERFDAARGSTINDYKLKVDARAGLLMRRDPLRFLHRYFIATLSAYLLEAGSPDFNVCIKSVETF